MSMPRFVLCKVVNGRSVPVSLKGVMHRMRVGDDPISIPFQVYVRHAWKMELVGESIEQVRTAMMEGDDIETTAPAVGIPPAKAEKKEPEVLEWKMTIPPEDYWNLYKDKKNPSKTVLARLELAKKLIEAKDGQTE